MHLCTAPECNGPLLVQYDLDRLRLANVRPLLAQRPRDLWRYAELLPLRAADYDNLADLGEDMTPLLAAPRLAARLGLARVWVKDESRRPTCSFKSRGSAVAVTRAAALGARVLAIPTNGNAGAAWAAYGARIGLAVVAVMPDTTPSVIQRETAAYGARVIVLRGGTIGDAGALVRRACAAYGWYDASTLREPYRCEGKKTLAFEVAEQLGWRLPERLTLVYPTGGGIGIIAMLKGFRELIAAGWLPPETRLPRMVCVQATGCAPLVRALAEGQASVAEAWAQPATIASGLRVPQPLGGALVLQALRETGGTAVAVTDADLLAGVGDACVAEGLLVCPEGGATVAAVRKLLAAGWLQPADEVVLFNTGSGLKYPDAMAVAHEPRLVDMQAELADVFGEAR